jgi:hypothetical protein
MERSVICEVSRRMKDGGFSDSRVRAMVTARGLLTLAILCYVPIIAKPFDGLQPQTPSMMPPSMSFQFIAFRKQTETRTIFQGSGCLISDPRRE